MICVYIAFLPRASALGIKNYLPKSNVKPAKKERPYPNCALPPEVPWPLLLPGMVLETSVILKRFRTPRVTVKYFTIGRDKVMSHQW